MKRIIAPLVLALLSTVAIAESVDEHYISSAHRVNKLPAWDNNNYKNFTIKTIAYKNEEECIDALKYITIGKLGGSIIGEKNLNSYFVIGNAYDANTDKTIRVLCNLTKLIYLTAIKLSPEELKNLEDKKAELKNKARQSMILQADKLLND